jgi:hypothetical protein
MSCKLNKRELNTKKQNHVWLIPNMFIILTLFSPPCFWSPEWRLTPSSMLTLFSLVLISLVRVGARYEGSLILWCCYVVINSHKLNLQICNIFNLSFYLSKILFWRKCDLKSWTSLNSNLTCPNVLGECGHEWLLVQYEKSLFSRECKAQPVPGPITQHLQGRKRYFK